MLDVYKMPADIQKELVTFIFDNKQYLREISLRMVLKIADLWKMAPSRYKELAIQTCMKPDRGLYRGKTDGTSDSGQYR